MDWEMKGRPLSFFSPLRSRLCSLHKMDWTGQRRAEAACLYVVVAFGVIAFLAGFLAQDFLLMMKVRAAARRTEARQKKKTRSKRSIHFSITPLPSLPPLPSLRQQIYGSGVAATALAIIPNWPIFNRDGLTWLPVKEVVAESKVGDSSGEDGEEEVAAAPSPAGGRQRRLPVVE